MSEQHIQEVRERLADVRVLQLGLEWQYHFEQYRLCTQYDQKMKPLLDEDDALCKELRMIQEVGQH